MNADTGIDAAISAFIRHSELGSIKYTSKENIISMEMIIKGSIDEKQKQQFIHKTNQALHLFYKLRQIKVHKIMINFATQADISIMTFIRDDSSLSEEEIDLYVALAGIEFSALLLNDMDENFLKEKLHNDMKRTVLDKINHKWKPDQKVIAYRDQGKMFVFDK